MLSLNDKIEIMKKIILFTILFLGIAVNAQELTWHTDMTKATEIAIKEKKPLLLFFTGSDWCGWCVRLQNEVLKTPEFKKWASENVVLVELDFPRRTPQEESLKQQNAQLAQALGVQGFPTLYFVTPSKTPDNKVNLNNFGSQGYVAGGPVKWLEGANQIMKNKS